MVGGALRYAWYGRVSTEDEQDPTLSFPRQLANASARVQEAGGRIVAHYYDVESGTRALDARGSGGLLGFAIPIARDGGLQELLADAALRPARFERVIVESISRISRNSSVAFRIEEELASSGVRLCAADEPLEESFGTIVLRHVNIGIARGYHYELMAKSRQGSETSVRQGWHTGGAAPYGYALVGHPHPNPHKAKQGAVKCRLELDPVRAQVVRRIYDRYLSGQVGLRHLQEELNRDPDSCPPPRRPGAVQPGEQWSRSSVWEILRNPKYTGYQVWNRRARQSGGRSNDPSAWVWSEQPSHPAIVTRAEFEAVRARAKSNHRSAKEPAAGRTRYLYRSILRCGACGLRMWGKSRPSGVYYQCQLTHQRSNRMPADHPATVHLSEAKLNRAMLGFLATAVFGPERLEYWQECLDAANQVDEAPAHEAREKELEAEIADLERRLDQQVLSLEAENCTSAIRRRVHARIAELDDVLEQRRRQLKDLAAQAAPQPPQLADVEDVLGKLPVLAERLHELPVGELRALFDALQLSVTYHHARKEADVEITLHEGLAKPGSAQVWSVPPVGLEPTLYRF